MAEDYRVLFKLKQLNVSSFAKIQRGVNNSKNGHLRHLLLNKLYAISLRQLPMSVPMLFDDVRSIIISISRKEYVWKLFHVQTERNKGWKYIFEIYSTLEYYPAIWNCHCSRILPVLGNITSPGVRVIQKPNRI